MRKIYRILAVSQNTIIENLEEQIGNYVENILVKQET